MAMGAGMGDSDLCSARARTTQGPCSVCSEPLCDPSVPLLPHLCKHMRDVTGKKSSEHIQCDGL